MDIKQFRIKLIFEPSDIGKESMLTDVFQGLVGKKIKAFGENNKNLYHQGPEREFEVDAAEVTYVDDEEFNFFSLNVYLKDYDPTETPLYTDEKFEKEINKLVPGFRIDYSELGMQGEDFVNFDSSFQSA